MQPVFRVNIITVFLSLRAKTQKASNQQTNMYIYKKALIAIIHTTIIREMSTKLERERRCLRGYWMFIKSSPRTEYKTNIKKVVSKPHT